MSDEELLLSILIYNPHLAWKAKTELSPDDFSTNYHAEAFRAVVDTACQYTGEGQLPIALLPQMSQDAFDVVLRSVEAVAADPAAFDLAVNKVRDASLKRKLSAFMVGVQNRLKTKSYTEIVEEFGKFFQKHQHSASNRVRRPSEIIDHIVASGPARFETYTGVDPVDISLAPLRPTQFVVVGGSTASGKTSFLLQMARYYAKQGLNVLLCTLEMSAEEVLIRMLRQASRDHRISLTTIKDRDVLDTAVLSIDKHRIENILICDSARVSVDAIRHIASASSSKIDVVIVDYLQLMLTSGKNENRANEVSQISRGLKLLAKELDALVIAASQLSRRYSERLEFLEHEREFPIPQLSHLRESGSIEMDADTVLFVGRDTRVVDNSRTQPAFCHIAKQRFGESGIIVRLVFDKALTLFGGPGDEQR